MSTHWFLWILTWIGTTIWIICIWLIWLWFYFIIKCTITCCWRSSTLWRSNCFTHYNIIIIIISILTTITIISWWSSKCSATHYFRRHIWGVLLRICPQYILFGNSWQRFLLNILLRINNLRWLLWTGLCGS